MSKGYTGCEEKNQREFAYDEALIKEIEEKLEDIFDNPLIDSLKYIQFVRSRVFVTLDSLLTNLFETRNHVSNEIVSNIDSAITHYILIYNKWIMKVDDTKDNV